MAKNKVKIEETIDETVNTVVETPIVEEVNNISSTIGVVYNCDKLRIRKKPTKNNSPEVCIVDVKTELTIDESKSTKAWYKVTTKDGKEGFCMKDYVKVN